MSDNHDHCEPDSAVRPDPFDGGCADDVESVTVIFPPPPLAAASHTAEYREGFCMGLLAAHGEMTNHLKGEKLAAVLVAIASLAREVDRV